MSPQCLCDQCFLVQITAAPNRGQNPRMPLSNLMMTAKACILQNLTREHRQRGTELDILGFASPCK